MQVINFALHVVIVCLTFQSIGAWYLSSQLSKQDLLKLTRPGDGCDASLIKNKVLPFDPDVVQKVWVEGALWLEPHNCASLGNGTRDFKLRKNLVRVNPINKKDILYCCTLNDFGRSRLALRDSQKDSGEAITKNYFDLDKCLSRNREYTFYDANEFYKTEKNGPIRDDFGAFDRFDPRSYQHAVAIGWSSRSNVDWNCTGVLISNKFVLTSASCTLKLGRKPDIVRLGALDLISNALNKIQNIPIAKITKHPQYKPTSYYHDIAVIQLSHNLKKSYYVLPACLQTNDKQFALKEHRLIAAIYNRRFGDVLQQTDVEILDTAICNKKFGNSSRVKCGLGEGQLCAKTDSRDFFSNDIDCPDNGGGPMQFVLKKKYEGVIYKSPVVFAITSAGIGCFDKGVSPPGVHTKISGYFKWIEHVIFG